MPNKYSADIRCDLIGHMVDQQQIPLAIFGEKRKVICQEPGVYSFICNYHDTGICQDKQPVVDFYTGVQGAKINPQVNHVLGLKGKEEGKGGGGGLGNLLVSAHDGVCINELQVGNRG